MVADTKTFLDDAQSLKALIQKMPDDERREYLGYGALSLESCFPSRKMVVYTLQKLQPSDIDVISFGDFRVDWDMGPSCEVQDRLGTSTVVCTPRRLRPRELFLHIPQNFQLKYRGRQDSQTVVHFVSHFAVLIKTRSKEMHQVDGHTYLTTLNNFRERFPGVRVGY